MGIGVYSDKSIREFVDENIIRVSNEFDSSSQIQPSSFDLKIGGHFYCLPYSVLPSKGEDLESFFKRIAKYEFEIQGDEVGFLHKRNVYVVRIQESLSLPNYIIAKANPKSSIGRIDLHVRLMTEDGASFDEIPAGYDGELWLELYPRSFDVELTRGTTLSQVRFMDLETDALPKHAIVSLNREDGLLFDSFSQKFSEQKILSRIFKNAVTMSVNIEEGVVAYIARDDAPPINLSKRDLPFSHYFDPVYSKQQSFIVNPDSFYILSSHEIINIPPSTCAEMIDIDTAVGEFRGHYAGFFDPAFSSRAVLELRNYGPPFVLKHGQIVSGLKYFEMKSLPDVLYGAASMKSSYQGQRNLKLAKFFDMDK